MKIRLKYAKPLAPGAQVNLNLGYQIQMNVEVRKAFENEWNEVQYSYETELKPVTSIFLDKTSTIDIPMCRENVEAIEKLTLGIDGKGVFRFADDLSEESFMQAKATFAKTKPAKKKQQIAAPKKEVAEALEAKEL